MIQQRSQKISPIKIHHSLFLGLCVTEALAELLKALPLYQQALLISSEKGYLSEIHFEGGAYLGKIIDSPTAFSQLEMLESHIFSILQKFIPSHPYKNAPLILFPLL